MQLWHITYEVEDWQVDQPLAEPQRTHAACNVCHNDGLVVGLLKLGAGAERARMSAPNTALCPHASSDATGDLALTCTSCVCRLSCSAAHLVSQLGQHSVKVLGLSAHDG